MRSHLAGYAPAGGHMLSVGAEKAEWMVVAMEAANAGGMARRSVGLRRAKAGAERAMRASIGQTLGVTGFVLRARARRTPPAVFLASRSRVQKFRNPTTGSFAKFRALRKPCKFRRKICETLIKA